MKIASLDPIIIHDQSQLTDLARDARLLSHKANQKLTLEKANYDNSFNSIFSGFITSGLVILIVGSCIACILWRINLLSCLINCLSKKSQIVRDHDGVITFNMDPKKLPKSIQSIQSLYSPDPAEQNKQMLQTSVDVEMHNLEKS